MPQFEKLVAVIQKLDGTLDLTTIPPIFLSEEATLDDIRRQFTEGPLGSNEKDIFFPTWTKTIHVLRQNDNVDYQTMTFSDIDESKITIESDEQLQDLLRTELSNPGSFVIVLQQCRSKRYSRKGADTSSSSPKSSIASDSSSTFHRTAGNIEKPNQLLGGSSSSVSSRFRQNCHHHHHHHHHTLYHHQHQSRHKHRHPNQSQNFRSSLSQPFGTSNHKRGQNEVDASASYETTNAPSTFISSPVYTTSLCTPSPFETSDQMYYIYPDPLPYGMFHSQPLFPQFYAVPCNINCYSYVPVSSFPSPWSW